MAEWLLPAGRDVADSENDVGRVALTRVHCYLHEELVGSKDRDAVYVLPGELRLHEGWHQRLCHVPSVTQS